MKTGIFITARLGSTRLKRKHLLPVNSNPIISYLIGRIVAEFRTEINQDRIVIIITTSGEPENREFERFVSKGVTVFYGSKENIPLRHLQAAKANLLDAIVSVDGDDMLCSVKGMREVFTALTHGATYVKTSNLPFGMNSFGYQRTFLEASLKEHLCDTLETGWGRIFDETELKDIQILSPVQDNSLRFTLDYEEDYRFFSAVIESFGTNIFSASDEDIVKVVLDQKLYLLNESISSEYWKNFYRVQEEEREKSLLTRNTVRHDNCPYLNWESSQAVFASKGFNNHLLRTVNQ
jgi:spore coat polysaccharide biosynthesis protein SpsF (cytidylyltransferase family)